MQLLNSSKFNVSPKSPIQPQTQSSILKGFKSFLANVAIVKSSVSMLFGDYSLETVGELTYGLLPTPAYDLVAQHLNQDPACAELIRERYIPPAHDLDILLTYPSDSLGYIYATQMKQKGFDPNLHSGMTASSDAEYIELRISQTHDIWHIVTGFGTSLIDEIGLQAFYLSQFPYPLATMIIANNLVYTTLKEPEMLPSLLAAIAKGFNQGKTALPLFAQKWEESWEKPLTQWRAELNIQPIA